MWSHGSHVTSSRALCGPPSTPLRCCIISTGIRWLVLPVLLQGMHARRLLVPLQHSVKGESFEDKVLAGLAADVIKMRI